MVALNPFDCIQPFIGMLNSKCRKVGDDVQKDINSSVVNLKGTPDEHRKYLRDGGFASVDKQFRICPLYNHNEGSSSTSTT